MSMLSATFTAFKFMPAVQMVTAGKESSETGLTWWERIKGNSSGNEDNWQA